MISTKIVLFYLHYINNVIQLYSSKLYIFEERKISMKKILNIICCALGSGMIGFFANKLDTVNGSVLFAAGVILLVSSAIMISAQDKKNK